MKTETLDINEQELNFATYRQVYMARMKYFCGKLRDNI